MELKITCVPDGVDEDGNPVVTRIDDLIADRALSLVEARINKRVDEYINKDALAGAALRLMQERVQQMLPQMMVHKSNQYGYASGQLMTLEEFIKQEVASRITTSDSWGLKRQLDDAVRQAVAAAVEAHKKEVQVKIAAELVKVLKLGDK